MLPLIESKRGEIDTLCQRFGVRRLDVFGSAARATDFDATRSDLDFLVELEPDPKSRTFKNFCRLKDALEALLGHPVDLVMPGAIENPYLRANIDRSREPVFGS